MREPDLCKIIHRDVEKLTTVGEEIFRTGFFPTFLSFVQFLKSAEKSKFTRKFKDMELVAAMLIGSLAHFIESDSRRCLLGRSSIRNPKTREDFINTWADMTFASLGTRSTSAQES